jgi:CheY-like chemotaxis protein
MQPSQPNSEAPSVLLVEDEQVLAMHIEDELERAGYRVMPSVMSGEAAIEAVAAQRPSVVLMDIRLAGALDGVAAAEEIYVCESVPVVMLTASREAETLARVARSGAYGLLLKPFDMSELLAALSLALAKHAELRERSAHDCVSATATLLVDSDGVVCAANRCAESLLGPEAQLGARPNWARALLRAAKTEPCQTLRVAASGCPAATVRLVAEPVCTGRAFGWVVRGVLEPS